MKKSPNRDFFIAFYIGNILKSARPGKESVQKKGLCGMLSKNSHKITDTQSADVKFVKQLIDAINNGCVDSAQYFDDRHLSLMVDNYQIDVAQTDVFYYDGFWKTFLGIGQWGFKPGELERYSLSVMENSIPIRWQNCPALGARYKLDPDGAWRKQYNIAFMAAAMATNKGFYRGKSVCTAKPDAFYFKQNEHLFEPLKKLWIDATTKYPERKVFHNTNANEKHGTRYELPNVESARDLLNLRNRVLAAIQNQKIK